MSEFAGILTRTIAPVLKELYPNNPDPVIGHEASRIAQAIAPAVMGVHDPTGQDHLAEMMTQAQLADRLLDTIQRALTELENGDVTGATRMLQHADTGDTE